MSNLHTPADFSTPSIEDVHGGNALGAGFADEQPADAFPPEPEYSPEEEAEMERQYLAHEVARRMPADYVDAACATCGAAIFVPAGATRMCNSCDAAHLSRQLKLWTAGLLATGVRMAEAGELYPDAPETRAEWLVAARAELAERAARVAVLAS